MMKIKRILKKLSDFKNAYRVLSIMDKAGCDIEKVEGEEVEGCYRIKPRWYVSKQEAEDLRKIVLFKQNYYGEHNRFWFLIFNNIRRNENHRFL